MTLLASDEQSFGAFPQPDGGVKFQVWAPHAEKVAVVGEMNKWEEPGFLLEPEENGFWVGVHPDAADGQEYEYRILHEGTWLVRKDPAGFEMTNSVGHSLVVDHNAFDWADDASFESAPLEQTVIYEMHLGTFARSDPEKPGSFYDAIEQLDHLVNLGVTTIEMMPVSEFAGGLSWGYNPAFPFAIESDYGGAEGLKCFVKACHEKGLSVIMDVVYNHFGPSDLDMWQFDGWSENDLGGIFFYNDNRAETPWGHTRPDYGREEVRKFIRDNALMWFRQYHVDGLRMDMIFYIRNKDDALEIPEGWSLMRWIHDEIYARYPKALTIAEDLRTNEWVTKPTSEGGAGFRTQWDEQFVHPIRKVLTTQEDAQRDLQSIIDSLSFTYNDDYLQRVVYTESHDEVANGKSRVPTEIDSIEQEGFWAQKRSALGIALVMTAPGIPMIFQGQEILTTGFFEDTTPFDWNRLSHMEGFSRLCRDLIHLRTNREEASAALCTPDIRILHVNYVEKILSFERGNDETGKMLVLMNFSYRSWESYRCPLPQAGEFTCKFRAASPLYSSLMEGPELKPLVAEEIEMDGSVYSAEITLGAYDCLIYSFPK